MCGTARFNRTRTVSLNRVETASSAAAALTDSRLAALCAEAAQHAFANYQGRFDEITRRARERFLAHDLKGSYADSAERLHLYGNVLANLTTQITDLMGPRLRERNVWTAIKAVYSSFVAQSRAWEIGESFFNSLTRRVFAMQPKVWIKQSNLSIPISMRRPRVLLSTFVEFTPEQPFRN